MEIVINSGRSMKGTKVIDRRGIEPVVAEVRAKGRRV